MMAPMTIQVDPSIDSVTFRRVLGHYPTGVSVITSLDPTGAPVGLVVGSFTSVSLKPPLVAFFPDKSSTSWPRIERAGRFCVNILAREQQDLCKRFAAKGNDKFAGLSYELSTAGSPVLKDIVAWIDCAVHAVYEAGDHFIVLGRVLELDIAKADEPLLFFRGGYGSFLP
jgi:3-hydroxy-9,10-secoandrosta-1,3,5(10)-triene-9,17-dione monooxygenase reductase component